MNVIHQLSDKVAALMAQVAALRALASSRGATEGQLAAIAKLDGQEPIAEPAVVPDGEPKAEQAAQPVAFPILDR